MTASHSGEHGSHATSRSNAPTLLSDALLRDLMAAGQADILIGLPTLDHVRTAGKVARTINQLFTTVYARQRTVLFNPDGGSTDGTQAAVAGSGAASGDLLVTSYTLRTLHQISAPYHGVPGRGSAMRLIFAAADLLNVRAVAVIGPEATELSVDDMARLIEPVLERGADYVKAVLPRAPHDGPLVTQLVRPLLGAVFGKRLLEPIDPLLACSRGFASKALKSNIWDTPFTQYGLDPWLGAIAALDGFRLAQVGLRSHRPSLHVQPEFSDVFRQVVESVFSVIDQEAPRWRSIARSEDVPVFGEPGAEPERAPLFDVSEAARAFRQGSDALQPLLSDILQAGTLTALNASAALDSPVVDDALWVHTVYDFITGYARRRLPLDQLVQTLQPIYLGRLCTLLGGLAAAGAPRISDRHERLAFKFEELKPELLAAWPMADAG